MYAKQWVQHYQWKVIIKMCFNYCSFPDPEKNPEMYALWVKNFNKDAPVKFVPVKGSRLCSKHFSSNMFKEGGKRAILKRNAIPTIFGKSQVGNVFAHVAC